MGICSSMSNTTMYSVTNLKISFQIWWIKYSSKLTNLIFAKDSLELCHCIRFGTVNYEKPPNLFRMSSDISTATITICSWPNKPHLPRNQLLCCCVYYWYWYLCIMLIYVIAQKKHYRTWRIIHEDTQNLLH